MGSDRKCWGKGKTGKQVSQLVLRYLWSSAASTWNNFMLSRGQVFTWAVWGHIGGYIPVLYLGTTQITVRPLQKPPKLRKSLTLQQVIWYEKENKQMWGGRGEDKLRGKEKSSREQRKKKWSETRIYFAFTKLKHNCFYKITVFKIKNFISKTKN